MSKSPRFKIGQKVRVSLTAEFSAWASHINEMGFILDLFPDRGASTFYKVSDIGAWIWEGYLENADMRVFTDGYYIIGDKRD